jgi:hypothetical protein
MNWKSSSALTHPVLLATAALVVAAIAVGLAPPHALAAPGGRVVVIPSPESRIRSHPVPVVIRAAHGLRDISVSLNGHRIGGEFGPSRKGLRRAIVGPSQGLDYGRNVLRVRAKQPNGRRRGATVTFRVIHDDPLAGAGRNRRVQVRRPIRLNGLASTTRRIGPAHEAVAGDDAGSAARAGLHYRWRLVSAPRPTHLRDVDSPRPTFTPRAPGSYVFRLTVGDEGQRGSDKVEIEVAPRSWLVPVKTMAQQGGVPGVSVGKTFYPAGASGGSRGQCLVQLVVLDRSTLGEAEDKTFGSPGCTADSNADANPAGRAAAYLAGLKDNKLVIAVSQPGFAAPRGLAGALASLGMPKAGDFGAPRETGTSVDPSAGGRVSAIGVPGLAAGQAQVRTLYDGDQPATASLDGYLTPDQYLNFRWLPAERTPFDTRAGAPADGSPGGAGNTIEAGGARYQASLPAGAHGGFQVLILDRATLQPRLPQQVFDVSDTQSPQDSQQALRSMRDYIASNARQNDLVFVDSLGSPSVPVESWTVAPGLSELAGEIAAVGGSRNNIIGSLRDHDPYSLVGRGGSGQFGGEEAIGSAGGARLRGVLVINNLSVFAPQDASSLSGAGDAFIDEVLKPPSTEWPLDKNPEAKAAFSWIGTQTRPQLGPDPRSAFVNSVDWDTIIGQVRAMEYPGRGHGFCEGVPTGGSCKPFAEAKSELIEEMEEVANVRTYIANITKPFGENALTSWASLQQIGNKIQQASEAKPDETLAAHLLSIASGLLELVPVAIPDSKHVQQLITEVLSITFSTALENWNQTREGAPDYEVRTQADRVGLEMAERFKDATVDIEHMGDVIVTDPAKLKYVGTIANCNPFNNPKCPEEWAWTDDVKTLASAALQRGTEAGFYQQLLPLAFPSYRIAPTPGSVNRESSSTVHWSPPDFGSYHCGQFFPTHPWAKADRYSTATVYLGNDTPQSPSRSTEGFEPFVSYAIGAKNNVTATAPVPAQAPQSVLDRMFSPVDPGGNPTAGGLGMNLVEYLQRTDATYGPQDALGSHCEW